MISVAWASTCGGMGRPRVCVDWRLMTSCRTGLGVLAEHEVIVIGGAADEAWALTWARPTDAEAQWTEADYRRAVARSGR